MEKIIKAAVDRGASDLHIKAGDVFRARIDGRLVALTKQALTPDQTKAIALRLIQNEDVRQRIDKILDYDCSWGAAGIGRFRVNILRQRSSFMIVMRVIPFTIPTVESLQLPPVIMNLAEVERGMILVTGVTGSGKSSTLAAMVQAISREISFLCMKGQLQVEITKVAGSTIKCRARTSSGRVLRPVSKILRIAIAELTG